MKKAIIVGAVCLAAGVLIGMRIHALGGFFRVRVRELTFAGPHHRAIIGKVYQPPFRPFKKRYPGILFCHGLLPRGKDTALYVRLMRSLAKRGYLVLAFDLRGFGESAMAANFRAPHDFDYLEEVKMAVSYMLYELPIYKKRLTVAGHSMGANLAFAEGASDDRVRNIILLGAGNFKSADRSGPSGKGALSRRFEQTIQHNVSPEQWDRITRPLDLFQYLPVKGRKNVLMVLADCDATNILQYNMQFFNKLNTPKKAVTIKNSNHNYGFDMQTANEAIDLEPVEYIAAEIDKWLDERK